jgi:L-asparaginase II
VAVVDEDGRTVARAGDPGVPIYLRSAAKPFQAIPLLAAGGERLFRLGDDDIALMCASHGGEPRHVRVASRLLRRGGFSIADLACGAHPPMHEPSARALVSRGERPSALHNNCSGKHAGLLLACRALGLRPSGYWRPGHAVQAAVVERLSEHTGIPSASIGIAIDGCSLPVFHLPLAGLALAYARLVSRGRSDEPHGPTPPEVRRRIVDAMTASPGMVAGRGRFTTDFLEAGRGVWIGKEGAEGVYAIGLAPRRRGEKALGIAFKLEAGASRARDAVSLDVLARLGRLPAAARRSLERYLAPVLRNRRGLVVGEIRADVPLELTRVGR